ncbi:MAG: sulfatase, partial [Bacillota bacterium]
VCNPSRASMWTGKYPHHYQCWNNHEGITEDVTILFDKLEENGYRTKAIGPLDYQHGKHSIRDQVGSWTRSANIKRPLCRTPVPEIHDNSSDINQSDWNRTYRAINWLQQAQNEDRPFMLYLTTSLVHPAFNALQRHIDRINENEIEIPPEDNNNHPVFNYQKITKNTAQGFSENMVKKIRKTYYAMIAALDEMIGQLLQAVEDLKFSDNTYIIFTSDHGEMAGEHSQILKRTMYEPSIHIPLIISGPDVNKGETVAEPVSLIDIYPTVMSMAGEEAEQDKDGESLLPLLNSENKVRRDWVFAEYHGDRCNTGTYMLRKGDWKYIKYIGFESQLFNLEQDPWEVEDLAQQKPEITGEMESILDSILDCEQVENRAREYDKRKFKKWRKEQKEAGTYRDMMAYIYSGYDRMNIEDIRPWTDEDEQQIIDWLQE